VVQLAEMITSHLGTNRQQYVTERRASKTFTIALTGPSGQNRYETERQQR
jgi:hypothetical protein